MFAHRTATPKVANPINFIMMILLQLDWARYQGWYRHLEEMSKETGQATDFIVLMSGEPQGGLKKRSHQGPTADYYRYKSDGDYYGDDRTASGLSRRQFVLQLVVVDREATIRTVVTCSMKDAHP